MKRWGLAVLLVACGGAGATPLLNKDGSVTVPPDEDAGDTTDGGMSGDAGADAKKDAIGTLDAPNPVQCQSVCPMNGGTCVNGVCVIDCGFGAYSCPTTVVCPKGVPCKVVCNGAYACGQGVDCSQASSCDITCGGSYSCGAQVKCGGGACTTNCTMSYACGGGIDCTATTCNLGCSGISSCGGKVSCNGQQCGVNCNGISSCFGGVCCTAKTCNVSGVQNGC